jgi:hypothetical protein
MTSLQTSIKQNDADAGFFINVGDLQGRILAYNPAGPAFSSVTWANSLTVANGALDTGAFLSSVKTVGSLLLKDMGKTVVSSLRTFRKIQVVRAGTNSVVSTFGVYGTSGLGYPAQNDYLTGYIELGFEGNGAPAPVARYGR